MGILRVPHYAACGHITTKRRRSDRRDQCVECSIVAVAAHNLAEHTAAQDRLASGDPYGKTSGWITPARARRLLNPPTES